MLRQAVPVLLLAAIASASYPKIRVLFHDPLDYQAASKCPVGAFDTPHQYDGEYQVTALYVTSHMQNCASEEVGAALEDIRITLLEKALGSDTWTAVGTGNYSQVAGPFQLLRVPITYKTKRDAEYLFETEYSGNYIYPLYWDMDTSAGPFKAADNYNPFIIGIEYERL